MLKNISQLEVVLNGISHRFITDSNAPLADVKEALFQFLKYVGQVEDQVKQLQSQATEEKKEEPIEEKTDGNVTA